MSIPGFATALLGSAASAPVFSSTLYTGTGAIKSVVNSLNLSGTGGLVWIKDRTTANDHALFDTVRGATKYLSTDAQIAETTDAATLTAFNSNGFSLGADGTFGGVNTNLDNYVAWAFLKAAGFLDIVAYTGNGTTQAINHALGASPGLVVIKKRSAGSTSWATWHNSLSSGNYFFLNSSAAQTTTSAVNFFGNNTITVDPGSTAFTVGSNTAVNANAATYIAYVFGSSGKISCGSYTGNGSVSGPTVTLGWQPQFLLIKERAVARDVPILDTTRGLTKLLYADGAAAESTVGAYASVSSTGFQITSTSADVNTSGQVYIYMAI